ncbi:testis-expressed protein 15 [Ochotona curzoniae]|uniref:testis-expressed protein 15 n=1 Tax=Ochotona curzoniae TaxID=130825 RepID=UPI001B353643|nr:testis-expressed protein 15 [Ochotona curzoniae]
MEMNGTAKSRKLWKMNSAGEPLSANGIEANPLKKFTIPKIRKTTEKVYLSPCYTNTREYSFIHDTLNQCRLELKCNLQLSWQFGDTKLVHNEDLEKKFTAKRSEMRENGRHGRELEEHFCFLALPHSDVTEIYQNGISTKSSTLKILGNPLLGIYMFRHVDIALNYAHSRNITVENIVMFKVLFGKVKKIQPSVDKSKVSLDPSPNFDCHMSRNTPSLKDTLELQAYSSVVYFYEYNLFSKPVDKPRQCLPYAVVTVKFIGQRVDNGHLMTSLRVFSTGLPKRTERPCSLNNCTVAKRIGKGKDATVIFEHFRKPADPFVQESCSCNPVNSEKNLSNSSIVNSYGNTQNGSIPILETNSLQTEHDFAEIRGTAQLNVHGSDPSSMYSDNRQNVDGDLLLNLTYLKSILSGISTTLPIHNNTGSSTVITSKLIKDPRLMKREENLGKQKIAAGFNDILPIEKSLDCVNSEINLSTVPANSTISSEVVSGDHAVATNCLATPCFRFSFDETQSQIHHMDSENYQCVAPSKATTAEPWKNQLLPVSFPIFLSDVVSDMGNQKHSEEKAQSAQQSSSIQNSIEQTSEAYESVNPYAKEPSAQIYEKSQSSDLKTDYQSGHQLPIVFPLQKKASADEYIQNIGKMKNLTESEDSYNQGEKHTFWKEINCVSNGTKISPIDNYISLNQKCKEADYLNSAGENCGNVIISQELDIPKFLTSTAKDTVKLDHLTLELESNLTPSVECASQKLPHHSLKYNDGIHTSFPLTQKLMELNLEKTNQNCVSIVSDALQEVEDITQDKKELIDGVISSNGIEIVHDYSHCNVDREHMGLHEETENISVSLENIQKDFKQTPRVEDESQDHTLFGNAQLNTDTYLNINCGEQRDNDKENKNEDKKEDSASSPGNNIENICVDKKQSFLTNNDWTNIDQKRNNENDNKVEISSTEGLSSTFNLIWKETYVPTKTTLNDTDIKQKDTENTRRSIEHLGSPTLPEITGSSVCVASSATIKVAVTTVPVLDTNHDHQRDQLNKTYSEDPDGCEIDIDKKLQDSFHHSKNENSVLQNFDLENEIELGSESGENSKLGSEYDDTFMLQQDAQSHGNVLYEEFEASYKALKSRIDWEGLLGNNTGEIEAMENSARMEKHDQHYCKESNCIHFPSQEHKIEMLNPSFVPDLKVRITNIFKLGLSPTADSFVFEDNFYKSPTDSPKQEINKKGEIPKTEIYSQPSGENSDSPGKDKSGTIRQESGLQNKSEGFLSSDLSTDTQVSLISERHNSISSVIEPSDVTVVNDKSECSYKKSKTDYNETKNENMKTRNGKRKQHSSFKDQNITHKDSRQHEICQKRRRLAGEDSSECFSSLSQGRIKTFSLTEKHIRNVLNILNSEASLCKSKRLSKKLDRAVLHLKKAHRRVHTSLQLITKVGEQTKSPLPKAYAIICNSFWESCDLQGYTPVPERRYGSTKHVLSKRRHKKQEEKKAIEFNIDNSVSSVSKHKSYKTNRERVTKYLSRKSMSSVSRSHTTIHVTEFCNQEHPKSKFPLCSASQSVSQSACINNSVRNPFLSELQPFSRKTTYLFSPDHQDDVLTEQENLIDIKFVSNISEYENVTNHSPPNNDTTKEKENFETNKEISECNSISLSHMQENTDKNNGGTCVAHTKVETDILISVLKSNVEQVLNDTYKQDNLVLSGCKTSLKVNFPVEQCTAPVKSSKPTCITDDFLMDPLNQTVVASKNHSIPQLLATTPVIEADEYSKSLATSVTTSHCQQECGGKELLKSGHCSSSECFHTDGNEANVIENSELDLTSATEETKNHRKNMMKKLSSSDSSLLLKDNNEDSSRQCITERDIQDRKTCEVEQAEKAKNSLYKRRMTKRSTMETEYQNQKSKILEESHLNEEITKTDLLSSHSSIQNITVQAVYVNDTIRNPLKRKREEDNEVRSNDHIHPDFISQTGSPDINHMPVSIAHSETSKLVTHQTNHTTYIGGIKKKDCSVSYLAPIAELSQILQRADKATSLQVLQEETKICQNMLPLFVKAFEKKQDCSLEQILISREFLVEQNLWNNCKYKLKPGAVDTLVELQMMMETIQFIENKKRLLEGEVTFRSLLWYDDTLYSELLGKPHGYQQQSSFYPGFQGRLKYNAFCELQSYHNQLVELVADMKRKNNSYYAFLKCKRQISECEAIMKHCSDCFDFFLSVPLTCGVNFGDSLGDLENVRKNTLKLISVYEDSPKVHLYPEKQDHLWIVIEMISSKVNFIKSNEAVSIKIALFGLEHIFFDAAKNLVWKERKQSPSKKFSEINEVNQCAFSKLQKICDTLCEDLSSEQQTSSMQLAEDTVMASRKTDEVIDKATINIENCRFNNNLLSCLGISCVGEILDQAEFADFNKLQELTLRCTDHLEMLKKYFQMTQQENTDSVLVTEENVLDVLKNHSQGTVILKSEAIETYIEIVMLSETIHFLKNSVAKKLGKQRFRGMLWFDLSLLPELIHCQENMASFSFLRGNPADCLWEALETDISEVKKDLDIIHKYSEAVNCSYAFHLFSRELEELTEIKSLVEKSEYSISTYINFVPYIASVNYGSSMTELECNYSQFSALLKNVMAAPQKDLGKMAHILKVMKTIEHLKIICIKNAELTNSFTLCQMINNRRSIPKLNRNGNTQPIKSNIISNTSIKMPSASECETKNVSNSSKKRCITVESCEDSQEKEKNPATSSCKKQKVNMNDDTKINKEKTTGKHPRIAGSHPRSEKQTESSLSDSQRSKPVPPEKVDMQRSPAGSLSPLKNRNENCTATSASGTDLMNTTLDASEHLPEQQGSLNEEKSFTAAKTQSDVKECAAFVICEQKNGDSTFLKDHELPPQKFLKDSPNPAHKSCLSNIKPEMNDSLEPHASMPAKPFVDFDIHSNLEVNDSVLESQGIEIVNTPIESSTCANSSQLACTQDKIPVLQISKRKPAKVKSEGRYFRDTVHPRAISFGASGDVTRDVNKRAECFFSEQQNDENARVPAQNAATEWNELPQSACTPAYNPSEHSFGISYPYYAWCVYHYSSSSSSTITQTYQGITSYQVQPTPGMFTTVANAVQSTHSQHFSCFAGTQANGLMPVDGYLSQMPISHNFQQPVFSQYASPQPLPQAAYLYPPNAHVYPEVPWNFAPWQQEPFHPRH